VNKKDLAEKVASDANLTRAQAARAVEAFVSGIRDSLASGGRVTISGFGTFNVSDHKARRVRDPRNGGDLQIAARRVPRFAPALNLRRLSGNSADRKPQEPEQPQPGSRRGQ
jgi:DNA-binding protein HU-beta